MAVQDPPIPHTAVGYGPEEPNHSEDEDDEKAVVWTFIWTLFVFKMVTVFLIIWATQSFAAGALLAATTWMWLAIPLFFLGGPLMYKYRLVKVRAKREKLRRAEWMLDDDPAGTRHHPVGTRRD